MATLWLVAGAAFLVAVAAIPEMMRLARRLNMIDRPTHRKAHSQPVPVMGGVAVLLGFVAGAGAFLALSPELHPAEVRKALLIVAVSSAAGLLGLVDDKFQIRPRYKLAGQFLVVTAFAAFGYGFKALRVPGFGVLDLQLLGIPLTVFWMLTIVNAVNFIDGVDGLAGSVALVIFALTGLMSVYLNDFVTGALAAAAIGATLAFLIFNWRPARIYMGDAGSLGLGMLISALLVSLGQNGTRGPNAPDNEPFYYQIPLVTGVAAYPLLEISLTVLRRLLRGKPIGSADRGHIHHRLLDRGWSASHVCYAAVLVSLLAGGAVIYSMIQYRGAAAWFLLAGGLTLGVGLHFCGLLDAFRLSVIKDARPHFLLANHFMAMQRIKLDMIESAPELHALLAQTCQELGIRRLTLTLPPAANGSEPRAFVWEKPSRSPVQEPSRPDIPLQEFSDRVEVPSGALAEWTFEPRLAETDIDVEYRVLMSELMRQALARAELLGRDSGADASAGEATAQPPPSFALLWRHDHKCEKSP